MIGRGPRSSRPGVGHREQIPTTAPIAATSPDSSRAVLGIRWLHPAQLANQSQALTRSTIIGRDPESDIVLDDETISRRHAEVRRAGFAFAIQDLGSRNGLFCDGKQADLAQLEAGRVLRLGDCVAVIAEHVAGDRCREVAPGLWGSHTLAQVVELASRAARSSATVLLTGETGTGKELFASLIHESSARTGAFVAVNCAALPENLIEAELFGHERGAFSGAAGARSGLIRESHAGTLFLDEVAELPLAAQAKLLRVLEAHEVLPLGRAQAVAVDLRVVCATHRDLPALVSAGAFRADLYGRLEGVTIALPPLRARREDIPELFLRFVAHYRPGFRPALSATFVEGLVAHGWPRNVRQLRQLAERMSTLFCAKPEWRRRDLQAALPELGSLPPQAAPVADVAPPSRGAKRFEREELLSALRSAGGNVTVAARTLSIVKQTMYKELRRNGIDLTELRNSTLPPGGAKS
jgi:DNA-binding NtrC family response regulator